MTYQQQKAKKFADDLAEFRKYKEELKVKNISKEEYDRLVQAKAKELDL